MVYELYLNDTVKTYVYTQQFRGSLFRALNMQKDPAWEGSTSTQGRRQPVLLLLESVTQPQSGPPRASALSPLLVPRVFWSELDNLLTLVSVTS